MESKVIKKIGDIALICHNLGNNLEELAKCMNDVEISKPVHSERKEVQPKGDEKDNINYIVAQLESMKRDEAESMLNSMKQVELARIYANFGASKGRSKPKKWLKEQIMWHFFDFSDKHRMLRGE